MALRLKWVLLRNGNAYNGRIKSVEIMTYIIKMIMKFVRFWQMPNRVTFDSNVWRIVASPTKFLNDPNLDSYQKLHNACRDGIIQGFLSETTFTLEQIKREDRLKWIKSIGQISIAESDVDSNQIQIRITLGPSNTVVPQITQIVQNHLDDAYMIGIRVLRSKRIAGPNSALLSNSKYFLNYSSDDEYHRYNNRNGEILRDLEAMGVGIANIKEKGKSNPSEKVDIPWFKGIASMSDSEKNEVSELVAEWADADAVATSIAHDVKYFCTNDVAKGSSGKGIISTMSAAKSKTITAKFGIQFITPNDLVQKLCL